MSERSVRLDLTTAGLGGGHEAGRSAGRGGRDAASEEEDRMRFRQALGAGDADETAAGEATARDPAASGEPQGRAGPDTLGADRGTVREDHGIFGLFGSSRMGSRGAPAADGLAPGSDAALAAGAVSPLIAGAATGAVPVASAPSGEDGYAAADQAGRLTEALAERILISADGGREARITLSAEVLPGVELHLSQEQGRWVVRFEATDAASFELLAKSGLWMAGELAQRLRSGVEIRVTDQPDAGPDSVPAWTFLADPPALESGDER